MPVRKTAPKTKTKKVAAKKIKSRSRSRSRVRSRSRSRSRSRARSAARLRTPSPVMVARKRSRKVKQVPRSIGQSSLWFTRDCNKTPVKEVRIRADSEGIAPYPPFTKAQLCKKMAGYGF